MKTLTLEQAMKMLWDRLGTTVQECYGFWGAYVSGHTLQGDEEFPLTRTADDWNATFDDWLDIAKSYPVMP